MLHKQFKNEPLVLGVLYLKYSSSSFADRFLQLVRLSITDGKTTQKIEECIAFLDNWKDTTCIRN